MPDYKQNVDAVIRALSKKYGYTVLLKDKDTLLNSYQCVALRDHMQGPTNALYRLQQGLQAYVPGLKILPPNLRKKVGDTEREDVTPPNIVLIPDCLITKAGNKRGSCNFYFSVRPVDLLAKMIRRMYLDGSYVESYSFCSLRSVLVVAVGFDKSDSDFIGTWRVCNRRKGNSSVFVQSFACLEGPVAENYENEKKTIGNDKFPVKAIVSSLVNDEMYSLTLRTFASGYVESCVSFVFKPTPVAAPLSVRRLDVVLAKQTVPETEVVWSNNGSNIEEGSADDIVLDVPGDVPSVPMPLDARSVKISLVTSESKATLVVGIQFTLMDAVAATWKLNQSLELGAMTVADVVASCNQISGHVANDGKQVNILTGQAYCSVGYPMPCCMVSRNELGQPPEWLMRLFLRHVIIAASRKAASDRSEDEPSSYQLPDDVVDRIGAMAGLPVLSDAARRVGDMCFTNSNRLWQELTRGGKHHLTQDAHRLANARVGSAFNAPIVAVPCQKENCGIMHTPAGHTNHFWISIGKAIKRQMKGCPWQARLSAIDDEVSTAKRAVEGKMKLVGADVQLKIIKSRIRRLRREAKRESNAQAVTALEAQVEAANEELRNHSETTAIGPYNLIHAGLREFEDVLKSRPKKDSKRPESDLEFVLWKSIETRAGGKLDMKQSGLDQTNRAGLRSLQNCARVFEALRGMYAVSSDIHKWLMVEGLKWERLGNSLFDVGTFLKSQRKRSPEVLDHKLLRLWCRWEDAFPGKGFNKFHGLFCTIRNFVHRFHMAGIVSEESNEAYNGTLATIKKPLCTLPSHTRRINKINERAQGNLKRKVMEQRLVIENATKKRKKMGARVARAREHDGRAVVIGSDRLRVVDGDTYVVLHSGNLLLKKWLDIFEWFLGGRAPQDWWIRLNTTAPGTYTDIDRVKEQNSVLV
jgi:hypothetical protein